MAYQRQNAVRDSLICPFRTLSRCFPWMRQGPRSESRAFYVEDLTEIAILDPIFELC